MHDRQTYEVIVEEKLNRYHREAKLNDLHKSSSPSLLNKKLAKLMRSLADKLEPSPSGAMNERIL